MMKRRWKLKVEEEKLEDIDEVQKEETEDNIGTKITRKKGLNKTKRVNKRETGNSWKKMNRRKRGKKKKKRD